MTKKKGKGRIEIEQAATHLKDLRVLLAHSTTQAEEKVLRGRLSRATVYHDFLRACAGEID